MYAKLFKSLYEGTLRGNSHGILVFTNLLAHCDQLGVADIHPRAISEEVGLSLDETRAALAMLEAPDPESRTPDQDGRRIARLDEHRDWGWTVVNYARYRAIRNADDRREQNRQAQERFRQRRAEEAAKASKKSKHDSKQSKQSKPPSSQGEGEAEAGKSTTLASPKLGRRLPEGWTPVQPLAEWVKSERPKWNEADVATVIAAFKDYWASMPGQRGVRLDWDATFRNWVRREPDVLKRSVAGAASAPKWKPGAEPGAVMVDAGVKLGIPRWEKGETHGQFRARIVAAGGEHLLKPPS